MTIVETVKMTVTELSDETLKMIFASDIKVQGNRYLLGLWERKTFFSVNEI